MKTIVLVIRKKNSRKHTRIFELTYGQAKRKIIEATGKYFTYPIIGYLRRQVMEKVFAGLYIVTDEATEQRDLS
jgi:hypothetical protein